MKCVHNLSLYIFVNIAAILNNNHPVVKYVSHCIQIHSPSKVYCGQTVDIVVFCVEIRHLYHVVGSRFYTVEIS